VTDKGNRRGARGTTGKVSRTEKGKHNIERYILLQEIQKQEKEFKMAH
jgi:hypothetical protein